MPDYYKRSYLEGGPDNICMKVHDWYRDSFYNIPRPWEERRQEKYETPMGGRESESTYGFHT